MLKFNGILRNSRFCKKDSLIGRLGCNNNSSIVQTKNKNRETCLFRISTFINLYVPISRVTLRRSGEIYYMIISRSLLFVALLIWERILLSESRNKFLKIFLQTSRARWLLTIILGVSQLRSQFSKNELQTTSVEGRLNKAEK